MNEISAKNLLMELTRYLKQNNISEAEIEAKLITMSVCNLTYEQIVMDEKVSENLRSQVFEIAEKRVKTHMPVQYLLGRANFMGLKFKINENVLIPRDETEILVLETKKIIEKILNENWSKEKIKILDIGTGSGIIPISLAKIFGPKVEILGIDISTKALSVAIENAQTHLESNLALFRKSDMFSNIHENEIFDIIVSNPPYVPQKAKKDMQKEVLDFEPHLALFTKDKEGVEFYEKIITQGKNHLKKGGYILFELGINQAETVSKMFSEQDFSAIEITKDLADIKRVIKAKN